MKKAAPFLIGFAVILVLGVSAYFLFFRKGGTSLSTPTPSKKQVINALAFDKRPFVAIFPHPTNKLITLMVDKKPDSDITVDIEYLSGNALKGGRTTILASSPSPYTQGFLLGSCSAGGKCSFDTDITTGTVKTKLELADELHLLKSNFAFVDGETATSDQKLVFLPSSKPKAPLIIGQTHGFIDSLTGEAAAEPVAITATRADKIVGTLTINAPDATSAVYFDGKAYQPLTAKKDGNNLVIALSLVPWSRQVTIIRDDLKGAEEEETLYLLGPIVPLK